MELGLKDILPIGKKHKGKKIEDIFKEDAGYLIWLRQARAEQRDMRFFDKEVSALLDMTIRESTHFQKKFKPWDLEIDTTPVTKTSAEPTHAVAYQGWGDF
jgi:hypothetical protein